MSLDTKDINASQSVSQLQEIFGWRGADLAKMPFYGIFVGSIVTSLSEVTLPGVYRIKDLPPLPDGSSLEYNGTICIKLGMDMYLLTMTHLGRVAYAFLNNGRTFQGWYMLT